MIWFIVACYNDCACLGWSCDNWENSNLSNCFIWNKLRCFKIVLNQRTKRGPPNWSIEQVQLPSYRRLHFLRSNKVLSGSRLTLSASFVLQIWEHFTFRSWAPDCTVESQLLRLLWCWVASRYHWAPPFARRLAVRARNVTKCHFLW